MLKKSMFTLVVLCAFIFSLQAQMGVRAGLNLSSSKVSFGGISASSDSKVGFHLGVVKDFMLTDKITFRPGVLFSLKGGKSDDETSNLTFVEIPLSLVYYFAGDNAGFFGELGPYAGILLSAKSADVDVKDGYNALDYGLNVGLGYDLGNIIIGANYGLGLANVAKAVDGFDVTAKNNNISIYGVYQF